MTTARMPAAGSHPLERLWNRSLNRYPSNPTRFLSLGIVVATTIVLYYQLYLSGGVATSILRDLHMSFTYYVNISVVGYLLGAGAAVLAGLADRYGRANIITVGLGVVGLLCLFALPNAHTKEEFAVIYIAIGFVEGIILVATPALVRDFSPQLGRASAMGFWTLGPVLGSLIVAAFVSNAGNASWQDQYRTSGIIGLIVFAVALVGLRELAPRLRDQLMVSRRDRELIEARAAGVDVEASLRHPFRQVLRADILLSTFAISVFLIIYYVAVGFFPVFFETVFGYSQAKANALGNYFWAFDAAGLLIIGVISDRLRVRKPFMVLGAVCAIVFTTIFAFKATHPATSYTTFKILLSCIAVSLALAFAPWMASFTETVERRNPALIATGLAVWGLVIRVVIAVSVFFVPKVITTATTLVEKGPVVKAVLTSPVPVGHTTIGQVTSAAAANPATIARLQLVSARDAALLSALKSHPPVAAALARAQAAGAKPTAQQLSLIRAQLGAPAFAELIKPQTAQDLRFLTVTAPRTLGAANFAAISNPTPQLAVALRTLAAVGPAVKAAATESPKQWRTFFLVGVGGEVVFIPLILLMAGFWSPRRAKQAEDEHNAWLEAEMAKLRAGQDQERPDDRSPVMTSTQ
ncbi:MAG: MFS transporter [Solirubrobacteraceae bacterium]